MKASRQWKVTVETERLVVLSRHGRFAVGWCAHCGQQVEQWPVADVQALAEWSTDQVQHLLAAGTLHPTGTEEHGPLLCANALRALLEKKDT